MEADSVKQNYKMCVCVCVVNRTIDRMVSAVLLGAWTMQKKATTAATAQVKSIDMVDI